MNREPEIATHIAAATIHLLLIAGMKPEYAALAFAVMAIMSAMQCLLDR